MRRRVLDSITLKAIQEYEMKVASEAERAQKAAAKKAKDAEKRAKADKVAVAK